MKLVQRCMAAVLAFILCVGMLPTTVFAAEYYPDCTGQADCTAPNHNGTCLSLANQPSTPEVEKCDKCGKELRFGKCTNPDCEVNAPVEPEVEKCDKCGGELKFGKCTNPDCEVNTPVEPEAEKCGKCGGELKFGKCTNPDCETNAPAEPSCKHDKGRPQDKGKDATCTENGRLAHWHCPSCGKNFKIGTEEELKSVVIEALGHSYEKQQYSWNGTGHSQVCDICNVAIADTYTAHTLDGNGNCTTCGYRGNPGSTEPEEPKTGCEAGEHTPGEWVRAVTGDVAATCTEAGSACYILKCASCKEIMDTRDDVVPAKGHTFEKQQYSWNGTGHSQVCDVCDEAIAGTYTAHTLDGNGNCTTCGYRGNPGSTEPEQPGTECAHTTKEWVRAVTGDVAATCTEAGSACYILKCTSCGEIMDTRDDVVPAKGHTFGKYTEIWGNDEVHEATCGICGKNVNVAHSYGEGVVTREATATEAGEMTYTCQAEGCGHKKTEVIPASGEVPAEPASDHSGHSKGQEHIIDAPTCTTPGRKTYMCFTCGDYVYESIPALGHSYSANSVYVDLGDGTHALQCDREGCDAHQGTSVAHTMGEWVLTMRPQVGIPGMEEAACTVCGYTAARPVAALEAPDTEIEDPRVPTSGTPGDGEDDGTVILDEEIPLAGLMTRAEFVNYLWEFEGKPASRNTTFVDVPATHPYYKAVGWAEANGIARGVDAEVHFLPDEFVTAGHARLFLERYAWIKGIDMPTLITLLELDDMILTNAGEVLNEFPGPQRDDAADDDAA